MAAGSKTQPLSVDTDYAVLTLHRAENTDDPRRLEAILAALGEIAAEAPEGDHGGARRHGVQQREVGAELLHPAARCVDPIVTGPVTDDLRSELLILVGQLEGLAAADPPLRLGGQDGAWAALRAGRC